LSHSSITLGHGWNPAHPDHSDMYQWEGFAYLLVINILGMFIIALRHDWVWCLGATWVTVSIWLGGPDPMPIYVCVLFLLPNLPLKDVFNRLLLSSSLYCIQSRLLPQYSSSTSRARSRRVESVFPLTKKHRMKGTHEARMKSRQIGVRSRYDECILI